MKGKGCHTSHCPSAPCHRHMPKSFSKLALSSDPLFLLMVPEILLSLLWTPQIPLRHLPFPNSHNQSVLTSQNHSPLLRESWLSPLLLVLPRIFIQTLTTPQPHYVAKATKPFCPHPRYHFSKFAIQRAFQEDISKRLA